MRAPILAEEASVLRRAADMGLDVDRLARDMSSPAVQADPDRTGALADIFGAIPEALLRQIAEDEASTPDTVC